MAKLKCPKCGKTFAMAMHLGRHMTAIHGAASKKAAKSAATPAPRAGAAMGGAAEQLASLIEQLQAERQQHANAVAEIDATFSRFGLVPVVRRRPGRPRRQG